MLQRCGRNFAGTHRTAEHGEQLENVVSELTHAAKHVTSENLLVTMRVGHLDAMSNVVGAAPLFVHRSDDAKSSSAVEPNDEDISGATALCNELPDDQRCIADQFCFRLSPTTLQRRFICASSATVDGETAV
jgi:hypothetical protein